MSFDLAMNTAVPGLALAALVLGLPVLTLALLGWAARQARARPVT